MTRLGRFGEIWCVDFEFGHQPGCLPQPRCMVAHELSTGRTIRGWLEDGAAPRPPFSTGNDALFVAYFASAELGCHLALGWDLPANVLDLYAEFRWKTNGMRPPTGNGLVGALMYHGLPAIQSCEKDNMRALALRGGPYAASEKDELLAYCETDVRALARLLRTMADDLDMDRALLRGCYTTAVAKMEQTGVPLDTSMLQNLATHHDALKRTAIYEADAHFGVYDGTRFCSDRWRRWIDARGLSWPTSECGRLLLDRKTFQEAGALHPEVKPISDLRHFLGQMREVGLAVGPDGRNRTLLSPFRSETGRNQPSNTRFIFGAPSWMRGLIQPPPGRALAHVDWSQQEFGIAAALSGDEAMMEAYRARDPYLAFAKQAGAVPESATKDTARAERERFKACALGVMYGMGAETLAGRIGQSPAHARHLLSLHRKAYPRYWTWSAAAVDEAMLLGRIQASFGWQLQVTPRTKPGTLLNFPMQANGAEMLRIACILATEQGLKVCAPVHDAIVIEAPASAIEEASRATQGAMAQASRLVLGGFELRTDVKTLVHPQRLLDHRSLPMWEKVTRIVRELERKRANGGARVTTRSLSSSSLFRKGNSHAPSW